MVLPEAPIHRDERGMTLIEILTALILFGMVASILYSFLFMGMSMYKRVTMETQMRNQSDALFGGLMSELRDAVHVEQGSGRHEIIYVKSSSDPDQYVDTYRMVIEQLDGSSGVTVYHQDSGLLFKRYELTQKFVFDGPGTVSVLQADGPRAILIQLQIVRSDVDLLQAEKPVFTVASRVMLSRLE